MSRTRTAPPPAKTAAPTPLYRDVTPDMAQKWIDQHNAICDATGKANYRPRSNPKEADLSGQMTAGNWTLGWDGVAISPEGLILNGQTRLHALVDSGTTQKMLVIVNFPEDGVDTGDRNRNRTNGDHYRHLGKKYYKEISSAAIMLWHWQDNSLHLYNAPPGGVKVLDDVLADHPGIEEAVHKAQTEWKQGGLLSNTVIAVLYYKFAAISEDDATDFFNGLISGVNSGKATMDKKNPVYRLRAQLQDEKADPVKYERAGQVYKVMLAWNDFRAGKERTQVYSALTPASPGGKPKPAWLVKGWPTLI